MGHPIIFKTFGYPSKRNIVPLRVLNAIDANVSIMQKKNNARSCVIISINGFLLSFKQSDSSEWALSPHWLRAQCRLQVFHHLVSHLHLVLIEGKQSLHL